MTLDQSIKRMEELKKETSSFWSRHIILQWIDLLEELELIYFSNEERDHLETQLKFCISNILESKSRVVLRNELKSFLDFLNTELNIRSYNYLSGLFMVTGLLISLILGVTPFLGMIAGALIGIATRESIKRNRRSIALGKFDLW